MRSFLLLLFFCSGSALAAPRSLDQIRANHELRICYTPWRGADTEANFPSPYLEIAVEFAKSLKLTPKVVTLGWAEQFEDGSGKVRKGDVYTPRVFDAGICDLLANNLSPLPEREKIMSFNWLTSSKRLVVVKKSRRKEFSSLNDLQGKRTIVVPNTSYHEILLDINAAFGPGKSMSIEMSPTGGTISQLLAGKADFVILEATQAMFNTIHVSNELAWAFPVGEPTKVGWGFPKTDAALREMSERYLQTSRQAADGVVNLVFRKYFGISLSEYDNLQFFLTTP